MKRSYSMPICILEENKFGVTHYSFPSTRSASKWLYEQKMCLSEEQGRNIIRSSLKKKKSLIVGYFIQIDCPCLELYRE